MKNLQDMSVDSLVRLFSEVTADQGRAVMTFDTARHNTLYAEMTKVGEELKRRPGDQRRALTALYDHPSPQVRLMAADMNLAIDYGSARAVIQRVIDNKEIPFEGRARSALRYLDNGFYKPK